MWLGPLYILGPYVLGLVILELLTLAILPRFRVTVGNVVLFVFGGLVGMLAISHFSLLALDRLVQTRRISLPPPSGAIAEVVIAIVGAELGGIPVVWLRMRLRERA